MPTETKRESQTDKSLLPRSAPSFPRKNVTLAEAGAGIQMGATNLTTETQARIASDKSLLPRSAPSFPRKNVTLAEAGAGIRMDA